MIFFMVNNASFFLRLFNVSSHHNSSQHFMTHKTEILCDFLLYFLLQHFQGLLGLLPRPSSFCFLFFFLCLQYFRFYHFSAHFLNVTIQLPSATINHLPLRLFLLGSLNSWKRGDLVSVFYSFFSFVCVELATYHTTFGRHHEDLTPVSRMLTGRFQSIMALYGYDARLDASPATGHTGRTQQPSRQPHNRCLSGNWRWDGRRLPRVRWWDPPVLWTNAARSSFWSWNPFCVVGWKCSW